METNAAALPNIPVAQAAKQTDSVKQWHEQIDRITYLASLASKFEDVDPMMDDLRGVTAVWDGSSTLELSQQQKLRNLEARLKQYLITSDPLRTFTAESLEQQLAGRTQKRGLTVAARSVIVIVLLSLVAAGLSYLPFIPIPAENRPFIAVPLFFMVLSAGIGWLYLTTLKNFNEEVRKAFRLVAAGAVFFGLAFSHYAAIGLFDLQRYPIFQFAGITWLVTIPYILIYLGIRTYAKQLGIRSWAAKVPIVAVALLVLLTLGILEPVASGQEKYVAYFQNTGDVLMPFFALLAVILVRKIRKVVTAAYARPITWMYAYLIVNFVTTALANVHTGSGPTGSGGEGLPIYIEMVIYGVPDQLLLMMTGYSFKKELSK